MERPEESSDEGLPVMKKNHIIFGHPKALKGKKGIKGLKGDSDTKVEKKEGV